MVTRKVPDEWYQCIKAGSAALRSPHEHTDAPTIGFPEVVVWYLPSFRPCHSWAFFRKRQTDETRMFHLVWRQDLDARRLNDPLEGLKTSLSPRPTLEASTTPFDRSTLMIFLEKLNEISLPVLPKDVAIGLDGESFGLRIFRPEVELSWWNNGPKQWNHFTPAVKSFIEGLPHGLAG